MNDQNTPDRSALSGEARKLLEALLKRQRGGRAQLSAAQLLEVTGLTRGALLRARAELTRNGLMRTESGFSAVGLRDSNVYVLNMGLFPSEGTSEVEAPSTSGSQPSLLVEEPELLPAQRRPERRGFRGLFRRSGSSS